MQDFDTVKLEKSALFTALGLENIVSLLSDVQGDMWAGMAEDWHTYGKSVEDERDWQLRDKEYNWYRLAMISFHKVLHCRDAMTHEHRMAGLENRKEMLEYSIRTLKDDGRDAFADSIRDELSTVKANLKAMQAKAAEFDDHSLALPKELEAFLATPHDVA